MLDMDAVERLTRAYGHELFARIDRRGPLLFSPSWWDERLMEWSMGDETVKVQLFRFIDALPTLRASEAVAGHLREYFEEAKEHLPTWARGGLHLLPRRGFAASLLAAQARVSARRLARRFIAGSDLAEALGAVAQLRRRHLAFTVDLLGEATITEKEAVQEQEEYLHLLDGLSQEVNTWPEVPLIDRGAAGPLPRVNVSVKLSALYSQFDPIDPSGTSAAVRERLRPILRAAQRQGAFVNVDMEQHAYKDLTIRIFQEVLAEAEFRDWPDVGIALQAYLPACLADLQGLLAWVRQRGTPVWVRLIKGAYWDYETILSAQEGWPLPVYRHKWETDANYERLTLFLLENQQWLHPAFGSHNIRSVAFALAAAQLIGLAPGDYEIQMLYGMAEPIKDALVRLGQRVRVYTPYGQLLPGMAYLVRRLLENTANTSFLRASFTEHVPEDRLLLAPERIGILEHNSPDRHEENGMKRLHSTSSPEGHNGRAARAGREPAPSAFTNEPLLDFSREEARQAMQQALAEVRRQLGATYPLVIAGRDITTSENLESLNPSHIREVVGRTAKATPEHARQAVEAAHGAFPGWRDMPAEERARFLGRAAEVLQRRRFELAAWEVFETAKGWREADADVAESIDYCRYYAQQMRRLAPPQRFDLPGEENAYFYEPRGAALVIAPWNFPLAILTGMTAAALVTGNTVVMKPAEQSTVIGAKLMEVFREIGLPAGVVNYLPGVGEEIGPTLVEHPDVALIAFTGSLGVGKVLTRQAAEVAPGQTQFKRLIAELGGKNAIIVDEDADLDEAVAGVVGSAFGYQGQKCSACSRAIVLAPIYAAFVERLVEATRSLKLGPAEDPSCKVGPVIDAAARARILEYVEIGKKEARLAYAGDLGFLVSEGYYVAPHLFADVPPTARIAQEEIFGPLLAILKVKDLDEALHVANGTSYALTGGIYSRSPEHLRRAEREFRVGNLYLNRKITGALVARQPFGGFRLSGVGSKAGGPDYLLQFVWPRTITENTMRRGFAPSSQPALGSLGLPGGE
jgi:RHH-type transcriptional regulator, proline utilization regulon repressor / proline dehydrogenase / delta 1-pyrroline-5-carboxylate dehydrogenase